MRVLARIRLLSTAEGGRAEPLIGSFRPNHSFVSDTFAIGEVEQPAGTALRPGESADLVVRFIADGVPELTPGRQWRIFDGPEHLIGSATLLQVLET